MSKRHVLFQSTVCASRGFSGVGKAQLLRYTDYTQHYRMPRNEPLNVELLEDQNAAKAMTVELLQDQNRDEPTMLELL